MPRITIVGSSRLFREALSRMLAECGYHVVAQAIDPASGEPTGPQAEDVDLVLTEMAARSRSPADWLDRIAVQFPKAKIILLTGNGDDPLALLEALAHGAHGYIHKSLSFETVRSVVDAVSHDQMVYPSELLLCLSRLDAAASPSRQTDTAPADPALANGRRHPVAFPARPAHGPAVPPAKAAGTAAGDPEASPGPPIAARASEGELSPRERQILGELAQGHSNKVIAFRLSLSEATVKSHLKSLLRKLGFSNRTQAAIYALKNPGMTRGDGQSEPGAVSKDHDRPPARPHPLRR